MTRTSIRLSLVGAASLFTAGAAVATDYNWNVLAGGGQTWQTAANWLPNTDFPNAITSTANLSVGLTGNLNVGLGGGEITLGSLNMGASSGSATTEISNGKLVFSNNDDADFDNDNDIDGTDFLIWQLGLGTGTTNATGDANADGAVGAPDLRAWRQTYSQGGTNATATPPVYLGRAVINSNGPAGSTNLISAVVRSGVQLDATPTYRAETVEVRGTQSLNLAGGYRLAGDGNILNSYLPAGTTMTVGPILLEEDTEATPTTNRTLAINTTSDNVGRVELTGMISGGGGITLGNTTANAGLATFVITGNNTFTGRTTLNRANVILASDTALGDAANGANLRTGNPSNNSGFNLMSDNDTRSINVPHQMAQFTTITGENSLTWAGITGQTNSRGFINNLPAGETFTHSGAVYAVANTDTERVFTFDGSGKTVVTGTLSGGRYNFTIQAEEFDVTIIPAFQKRGTGAVYLNGMNSYAGNTTVAGGNLHFGDFDGNTVTASIICNFGAVGVDTGSLNNFFFLPRMALTNTGGLMLAASESAANLDFTSGDLGSFAANMSVAAPETGMTYTGTITPAGSTYRLGGGSGTLTLPNAQLTGANSLVAANGGVVQLNGANTYSGTTSVLAKYTISMQAQAAVNGVVNNNNLNRVYGGTVLAVNTLANGGAASGIGNSSSAADNLLIQGSTLRYTGAGASTDRLFTVGTGGATVESSGAGAVNFTNTGALAMDEAEARNGTTAANNRITGLSSTADLVVGMTVTGTGVAAGATIAEIISGTEIQMSANATAAGTNSISFGSIARTLTLGGTNAGDNTLRPNIVNGAAATSVVKDGAGKWALTGANTYTGTTTVNAGTLLVNGTHTGGGAYTVAAGATLGGTGTAGGALTVSGTVAPGTSAGALSVSGGATFNAGSTLLIEIGGTGAGQFDELNLTGALAAGGTFDIDLINGFNPASGNSFDVLDFTSASGSFTLNLPALGGNLAWNTGSLLTTGTISVVSNLSAVPEPSAIAMALVAVAAGAARRRRQG